MTRHDTDFVRSKKRDLAARLCAEDLISRDGIAEQCNISRATLQRWLRVPVFNEWIEEHRTAQLQAVKDEGISNKQNRIRILAENTERLQRVIAERANDPLMADVPGGRTGVLVAEPMIIKLYDAGHPAEEDDDSIDGPIKSTRTSRVVYKFSVDTGTLKELRGTLQQAAQELGEWVEKGEQQIEASESFLAALKAFGRGNPDT